MSLRESRPLLVYTIDCMSDDQRRRLLMRPGITGYAQVSGIIELNYKERVEKDLEYIDNYSLLFDLKIFIKTVKVVFTREGTRADKTKSELEKY